MPTYVVLSRLTDEGRKTLKKNPGRIKEVNEELNEMGAKILAQYVLFGRFDFVNIMEVPDAGTMAEVAVEMGSRGTLKLETLQAMEVEELIDKIGG